MEKIVEVKNLNVDFIVGENRVHVLNNINFDIFKNEILAIIGETGCGKSVTGNALLHLLPQNAIASGEIIFNNVNIVDIDDKKYNKFRGGKISVVPQSPSTSLNPLMKIGDQVSECIFKEKREKKTKEKVKEIFEHLRMPRTDTIYNDYPYQLSGGMCQRVLIAMGMITNPELLVVDEPTKAIDWVLRKDVVEILQTMKNSSKRSMLIITHDIPVAKQLADRVAVMYCGEIVEVGSTDEVINNPKHPYTKGLINSMPCKGFNVMEGHMPSFYDIQPGCRFQARCGCANKDGCDDNINQSCCGENHFVKCKNWE